MTTFADFMRKALVKNMVVHNPKHTLAELRAEVRRMTDSEVEGYYMEMQDDFEEKV